MKTAHLDREEQEILASVERGEWKRAKDFHKEAGLLRKAAAETLRKDRRVNIRIAERDLQGVRSRAVEEGIPYQTLMASVIHKYITGRLIESRRA
ncbi:MAG: antitoxin [Candidatus Omnitrophica bacterium]|nr:antitoxin [Candidatus Omnitrophota bacterium]